MQYILERMVEGKETREKKNAKAIGLATCKDAYQWQPWRCKNQAIR